MIGLMLGVACASKVMLPTQDITVGEKTITVEVADEPFHVLFSDDGTHLHVALANGEVPRIDVAAASITDAHLEELASRCRDAVQGVMELSA